MLGRYPNITGTFTARYLTATQRESDFRGSGCFYYAGVGPLSGTNDAGDNSLVVGFDASGSNSIYKGNTVQSSAVQVLIIIKIWIDGDWTVLELPYISFDQEAEKSKFQLTLASSYRAVLWFFCLAWNAPLLDGKQHSLSAFRAPVMLGFDPNITGAFFNAFNRSGGYAGAFYGSGSIQGYNGTHNQGTYPKDTKFEAGKSNTIYKNSTTVQPLAFQVLIIIKIWNAVGCKVSAAPNIALSLFAENRAPNTWLRFASP